MARHIKLEEDEANKATDLYRMVINVAPEGMSLDEMTTRLSIIDKMDKAKGKMILEDAEFDLLSGALKRHKWPQAHSFIPLACNAVFDAEKKDAK